MQIFKYKLALFGTALTALIPSISHASMIDDRESIETVGTFIRSLKICHQKEWRNLSIQLEYTTDENIQTTDPQLVKDNIRAFLDAYAHPDDFWEVMNTNLVKFLAEGFPEIKTIKSSLKIDPDHTLNFPRESVVRYKKGVEVLKELFSFTKLNYLICQETFRSLDLHVAWEMKERPNPSTDYIDYQWVSSAMDGYFHDHPLSFSQWKSSKPELQAYLLERFPTATSMEIEITIVE